MVNRIYAIRDKKAQIYNQPYFMPSDTVAKRAVGMAMGKGDNQLFQYAEDFELLELGSFNDMTGEIVVNKNPVHIVELLALRSEIQEMYKKINEEKKVEVKNEL